MWKFCTCLMYRRRSTTGIKALESQMCAPGCLAYYEIQASTVTTADVQHDVASEPALLLATSLGEEASMNLNHTWLLNLMVHDYYALLQSGAGWCLCCLLYFWRGKVHALACSEVRLVKKADAHKQWSRIGQKHWIFVIQFFGLNFLVWIFVST